MYRVLTAFGPLRSSHALYQRRRSPYLFMSNQAIGIQQFSLFLCKTCGFPFAFQLSWSWFLVHPTSACVACIWQCLGFWRVHFFCLLIKAEHALKIKAYVWICSLQRFFQPVAIITRSVFNCLAVLLTKQPRCGKCVLWFDFSTIRYFFGIKDFKIR